MSLSGILKRLRCCPSPKKDIQHNDSIQILEVTGYNYRGIPQWFDTYGKRLIPIQFDIYNLRYRWTFYRYTDGGYYLITTESVTPTVMDVKYGKELDVRRVDTYGGYTVWFVNV